ncbi:MAG: multidrug effflux MFS transporter [Alphaproteobacteria bacterium]|nr:multidrug effflux MFS transporter [Alphaproteobacteria bacterium]
MTPSTVRKPPVPLLLSVQVGGIVAINVFAPSMPDIAQSLDTSATAVQWTITVFLIGFSAGQLVYGPISDRLGRRWVLFGGMFLFLAANAACAAAATIDWLLAARLVQGFGACCGSVLMRAIVRDLYDRDDAVRIMSYLAVGAGITAAVAPSIGSALIVFGWRANFWFLAVAAALPMVLAYLWLPETHPPERRLSGRRGTVLGAYATLFRSRTFLGYGLLIGSVNAQFFAFIAGAPFVLIGVMGIPAEAFGILMLMSTGGFLVGSLIVARLAGRLAPHRIIAIGAIVVFVSITALLVLALASVDSIAAIMLPMFVQGVASGFVFPPAMALGVGAHPRIAGTASGTLGVFQMGSSALATFVASLFVHNSIVPVATIMFVLAAIGVAALGLIGLGSHRGDDAAPG